MANASASHGSRNTGPSASHGRPGTDRAACRAAAGLIGVTAGFASEMRALSGCTAVMARSMWHATLLCDIDQVGASGGDGHGGPNRGVYHEFLPRPGPRARERRPIG